MLAGCLFFYHVLGVLALLMGLFSYGETFDFGMTFYQCGNVMMTIMRTYVWSNVYILTNVQSGYDPILGMKTYKNRGSFPGLDYAS